MQGGVKDLLGPREEMPPERLAATDFVLPQARLRLVDAQRNRFPHRRAVVLGIQPLFVKPMARFVQRAEKRIAELVRIVPSGQAAIPRPEARTKWMGGRIEPTALEIKADGGRGGFA